MVKQCGQNRLNAEREGANLEFQVAMNHHKIYPSLAFNDFQSSIEPYVRSCRGGKKEIPGLKIKL